MIERIKEIFNNEAAAIINIPITPGFSDAVDIIYNNVHVRNGKLVLSGMGKAGLIAHNIATTFSSTGTPAAYLHPSEAQHGDLGIFQENVVNRMLADIVKACDPLSAVLEGEFEARGGISTRITATYIRSRKRSRKK